MILSTLLKRLLKFILNSSYILLLIYILDVIILNEYNCEPMEKIWVKKELYF